MSQPIQSFSVFQEKFQLLLKHAEKLIEDAKNKRPYNQGLMCVLTDVICDLDNASTALVNQTDNEEISINAKILKNVLQSPVLEGDTKTSFLEAAQELKHRDNPKKIQEIILACALDPKGTEVLLEDLYELKESIDEELAN